MVDRNANIDFLFRNGLKDFEVLPPVDSWNKIRPAIRKKQMPFIIFRNAAAIAGLVSVSLLAYMLNREVNSSFRDQFIAVEQGSVRTPELLTVQDVPGRIAAANIQPQARQSHLIADRPDETVNGETENVVSSAGGNVPETRTLNIYRGIRALSGLSGRKAAGYNSDEATLYGEGEFTDYSFDTPKEKINRWSIAAMASPTYFARPQMGNDEIARQMMSAEQSRVSYSGGVS